MSSGPLISLEDYDAIASAVMETERGRWFLAEFARRNRVADTAAVLEALAAVEARLAERSDAPAAGQDADADALTRHIRAAAASAARVRLTLASAPRTGRIVTRSLAGVQEVERELADALAALRGAVPQDGADVSEPVEAGPAASGPAEAPPPAVEPFRQPEAPLRFAPAIAASPPAEPVAPSAPESVAERMAPAAEPTLVSEPATVIPFPSPEDAQQPAPEDDALDELAAALAEELERSRAAASRNGASHEPSKPSLPKAWTPGLLDGLSDAEKAILFA